MTYVGISGFACMNHKFPSKRFLRQFPDGLRKPFLPVLYGYFGKNWRTIKLFVKKFGDRPHLIQFHLAYRDADPEYHNSALAIAWEMEQIQTEHTKIIICPVLEDNIRNSEYKEMYKELKFDPGWPVVRSSIRSNKFGDIQEKHGYRPRFTYPNKKTIANLDGVSVDVGDGEKYFNQINIKRTRNFLRRCVKRDKRFAVALWSATQQGLGDVQGWSNSVKLPAPNKRFYGLKAKKIITPEALETFKHLLSCYSDDSKPKLKK